MSGGVLERPPRPEPTRVSPYFFEQLTRLLRGDDAAPTIRGDGRATVEGDVPPIGPEGCTLPPAHHETGPAAPSCLPASSRSTTTTTTTGLASIFEGLHVGPHRDGAGVPAPIFAAPQLQLQQEAQQQQQQQQQRVQRQELQQVLWTAFTPPPYTTAFSTFLREESDITEKLRRAVNEAWEGVETITRRNANRRSHLSALTAADAAWRDVVGSKVYWESADIVSRYGLEVGGPSATVAGEGSATTGVVEGNTAEQGLRESAPHPRNSTHQSDKPNNNDGDAEEHVLLDFSVLQANDLASHRAAKRESAPLNAEDDDGDENDGDETAPLPAGSVTTAGHSQRAKAYTTATKDLLDPCATAHPLRSLFAPLQRERAALPRWTTLLLQDAHAVQRGALPGLEARLRDSVLFKVPLHRPFREARAALQACARQRRAAPEMEAGQVAAFRQVEQLTKRLVAFVKEQQSTMDTAAAAAAAATAATGATGSPNNAYAAPRQAPSSSTAEDVDDVAEAGERWATAETLWTMLLTELDSCKRFLADAVPRCTQLRDTVDAETAAVHGTVAQHRSSCESTLARMKAEAKTCAELLTRNGQRTLTAVVEMEETFTPDQARLTAAIERRSKELTQLEGQQERNVRRLREALKACFVDQMKYEETAQALLQDQLTLAHLQVSHAQLRQAVQVRHEGAVESERHAAQLAQLLEDGDTVVHDFFTACEAHLRRTADDDHFIQCRLLDQCTLAMQQRCRCLHAMAALYDQRYAALEARAGGSWQLQFLLSGEQDWAVANLTDVRAELSQLEQDWAVVRAMRAAMEMDAVEVDAMVRTDEWAAMRATMLRLDAPASLQRHLPTLRAHSETLTHPAAGRGPQAVRRLLTS